MEKNEKHDSGQVPHICKILLSPDEKGGESSEPNGKELTILKVRPGMTYSKGGSIRMDSVKISDDHVHFMCIICESRFPTKVECTDHVTKNHDTSGSMCPVLRCSGPIEKHLPSSKSKEEKAKKKSRKTQSLPLSERKEKKRQKQLPLSSKHKQGRGKQKKPKAIENQKAKRDVIVVWNTSELYEKEFKHGNAEDGDSQYICYHCLKVFVSIRICKRHVKKSHPNQKLRKRSLKREKAHNSGETGTADHKVSVTVEESVEKNFKGSEDGQVHVQHSNIDDLLKLSAFILAFPELEDGAVVQREGVTKMYQCSECSQRFSTFGECGSHMKRVHIPNRDEQTAKDDLMQGVYAVTSSDFTDGNNQNSVEDEGEAVEKGSVEPAKKDGNECKQHGGVEGQLPPDEISPSAGEETEKRQGPKQRNKRELFYPCTECDRIFSIPKDLNAHIGMEHCGAGRLRCLACSTYSKGVGKEKHKELCEEVTKKRHNILSGVRMNNKPSMQHYFECVICGAAFRIERHFRRHVTCHAENQCRLCSLSFPSSKSLYAHVSFHNCGPLKCNVCNQTYYSTNTLLKHSLGHGKKFTCSLCKVSFTRLDNLQRHRMIRHREGKQRKYECQYCNRVFPYHYLLKLHTEKLHPEQGKMARPLYICHVCGISYRSEGALRMHVPYHDEIFTCRQCGCWFQEADQLALHKSRVHEDGASMPWRKVRQPTSGRSARPSKKAKQEGPLQCHYCEKKFTERYSLMLHEKKHRMPGRYKCGTCNLLFQTFSSLKYHRFHEHRVSQHMCSACGRKFPSASKVKLHAKLHVACPKAPDDLSAEENEFPVFTHPDEALSNDTVNNPLETQDGKEF